MEGEEERQNNTCASLPGAVCSALTLPSFLLLSSPLFNGKVNKTHRCNKPPSLSPCRIAFLSSSISPVIPELWQRSRVDLLFRETPSCSLLSCNQIPVLCKPSGSRQEEEYCLCGFITFILLLCQASKGEMREESLCGANVTQAVWKGALSGRLS